MKKAITLTPALMAQQTFVRSSDINQSQAAGSFDLMNSNKVANPLNEHCLPQTLHAILTTQVDTPNTPNTPNMPNMPNMPPVKQLMMVEGKIRNSSSIVSLSKVLDELATHHDIKDDYWIDWCKVLASHRAAKLNDQIVANKLLSSTIFEGYRYFSKA